MGHYKETSNIGYYACECGIICTLINDKLVPIKTYKGKKGYLMFTLNGKLTSVHRFIAKTFIKGFQDYLQVNHINGIKMDNRIENLEICTNAYNMKHAIENGLVNNRGSRNGMAKLTEDDIPQIRELIGKFSQKEIADAYHVNQSIISNIKRGKLWRNI